ncbi:hypothetical protein J6590_008430 [Homalodisca vitripennis]|nr:hypothetical protein J6590_008430 [Homalodisca vitripennis]
MSSLKSQLPMTQRQFSYSTSEITYGYGKKFKVQHSKLIILVSLEDGLHNTPPTRRSSKIQARKVTHLVSKRPKASDFMQELEMAQVQIRSLTIAFFSNTVGYVLFNSILAQAIGLLGRAELD